MNKYEEYRDKKQDKKSEIIESVFGFLVYITTIFIASSILAFAIVYLMNKYVG